MNGNMMYNTKRIIQPYLFIDVCIKAIQLYQGTPIHSLLFKHVEYAGEAVCMCQNLVGFTTNIRGTGMSDLRVLNTYHQSTLKSLTVSVHTNNT